MPWGCGLADAIAPARAAAAHVLLLVERGKAHADEQLRSPRVDALSRQDKDLATELVLGTLRWQAVLDRELSARLKHPGSDMHLGVITALRLGGYQLLFLDRIPPHAAINESVELAKQADGPAMAGLSNALLRRLLREKAVLGSLKTDPAAAYGRWMVDRWRARFGEAGAHGVCAWGQQAAPTTVRAALDEIDGEPGVFLTRARRYPKGSPPSANARMQDEASQLVGELAALDAGPAIWDTCAAPGGKTAILAERNPQAAIIAMDVSAPRLRIMERRMPWSENVRFVPGDATVHAPGPVYSTVLCDMPCSGTGTLGRNPEIRHRLQLPDLARQAERQRAILSAAIKTVQPGGKLVYSTCSLEPEENEQVVESIAGVTVEPVAPWLDRLFEHGVLSGTGHALLRDTAIAGPYLRTVPGVHPCDGFFAAVLRRV